MSTIESRNQNGRLQVVLWGGPGMPDLSDDANWTDIEDAEARIAEFAAVAAGGADNPFTEAGAARIWARWNNPGTRK